MPPLAEKCIESWHKFLPEYEIKRWDESNFDSNIIEYTRQAYDAKKYAFVSDYARLWILYNYGGLYFDTDVEIICPMDDIIASGPFMGCENPYVSGGSSGLALGVNPGLGIGAKPGLGLYSELLDLYKSLDFNTSNNKTIVSYTTELLCVHGLRNSPNIQRICGINIYPMDYFCPMDYNTGKLILSKNTRSIHHYAKSWHGTKEKLYETVSKIFGSKVAQFMSRLWKALRQ